MLLAIDVGNTNTVAGLFQDEILLGHWRYTTHIERTEDEIGVLLRTLFATHIGPVQVDAAMLSSVVPPTTEVLVRMVDRYFGVRCRVVGHGLKTGMPILYENPREVGADRIVNAVAAFDLIGDGLIVVDFGTATTFDVVTPKGEYLGGAICPGIGISSEALFRAAARLPRVEFARPKNVVGRNTVASMQSGLVFGYVGLVDGIVNRMRAEVGFPCRVIATGGLAQLIATESDTIESVDELLTLKGLRLLHARNLTGATSSP
ncbi:MAG: type III pantothenate kinase [Myxococcales bacterium]|nr:type III pantothenate kinase [Myxococcales bacterium]